MRTILPARPSDERGRGRARAFTLLEVLVAMGLFFLAIFAILDATNQSLRAARSLQINLPDASVFAADLYLTNRLEEGREPLDFADFYEADL